MRAFRALWLVLALPACAPIGFGPMRPPAGSTRLGEGSPAAAAWTALSPDGRHLAYLELGERWAVRVRETAGGEVMAAPMDRRVVELHWTPAGDALLAVVSEDERASERINEWDLGRRILRLPLDGGAPALLASEAGQVAIAAAGTRVVGATRTPPGAGGEVFVLDPATGGRRTVYRTETGRLGAVEASADGRSALVVETSGPQEPTYLLVLGLDDGAPPTTVLARRGAGAAWLPDGRIALSEPGRLRLLTAAGATERTLPTNGAFGTGQVAVSPDGAWALLSSRPGGRTDTAISLRDGGLYGASSGEWLGWRGGSQVYGDYREGVFATAFSPEFQPEPVAPTPFPSAPAPAAIVLAGEWTYDVDGTGPVRPCGGEYRRLRLADPGGDGARPTLEEAAYDDALRVRMTGSRTADGWTFTGLRDGLTETLALRPDAVRGRLVGDRRLGDAPARPIELAPIAPCDQPTPTPRPVKPRLGSP